MRSARAGFLLIILATQAAFSAESPASFRVFGYAQLTAEKSEPTDGLEFDADRVRAGLKYHGQTFFGGVLLDFNVANAGERTPGTLVNVIKDVYAGWRMASNWALKLGQFKTPIGMDFNIPGEDLDISKRGLEKPLVLERAPGLMLSGRGLGQGFGVDIGIFNPAGRSGATAHEADQSGDANAYAGRVLFDRQSLHLEAAIGSSEEAGGVGTNDYEVINIAAAWRYAQIVLKSEWISGRDLLGLDGRDEDVIYAHLGYRSRPNLEWIARHYWANSRIIGTADTDLINTYLGLNFWPASAGPVSLRVQLNYVLAGGDESGFTGLGGYRDDAVLAQVQISYP